MTSSPAVTSASKRLAIVAPSAESVLKLRASLVRAVAARRHKVLCLVPAASDDERGRLSALGAEWREYEPSPSGMAYFADRRAHRRLVAAFADWRPHVVMGYGLRPLILAARAAKSAGVARIISLCSALPVGDLASAGIATGPQEFSARKLGAALKASHAMVFHNRDDEGRLTAAHLMPKGISTIVVPGAGVDLEHFSVLPLPALGPGLVFLMISRLERGRGVADYAAAAAQLRSRAPGARFLLAGPPGREGLAISFEQIGVNTGAIEYLGAVDDVRPLLALCHVYVYPSHGEGMPRSVLEALACGRPIVTSSVPGCRETVDEHVNGWLVRPGDPKALAAAMENYLKRPDLIPAAARASRSKAERHFGETAVNTSLLEILQIA